MAPRGGTWPYCRPARGTYRRARCARRRPRRTRGRLLGCGRTGGRARDREDSAAPRTSTPGGDAGMSRPRRLGVRAGARLAVLGVRRCAGRVRPGLEPTSLLLWTITSERSSHTSSPALSALAEEDTAALQHERYRSHRAVRALLELLAAAKPLVLLLDDFHWADAASVELLGALLRRPPTAAVLIALAHRPHPLPERFSAALERAHRSSQVIRIELGELTPAEARELLGAGVDVGALYEESGGNPFYLEQLARSPRDRHLAAEFGTSLTVGIPSPSPLAQRRARRSFGHVTHRP